jgi:hypothetical protein
LTSLWQLPEWGFFFFSDNFFCGVVFVEIVIIQIWLVTKYEREYFLISLYIFGYLLEPCIEIWQLYFQKVIEFVFKNFTKMEISHPRKKKKKKKKQKKVGNFNL